MDDTLRSALYQELEDCYRSHGVATHELERVSDPYALWSSVYRSLDARDELQAHRDATKILTAFEIKGAAQATLFPGVADALDLFTDRGIRLAIVSSNDTTAIDLALERTEKANRFAAVIGRSSASEMVQMKPSPALITRAVSTLRQTSDKALYIGDSAEDMMAAKRANVLGVGVLSGLVPRSELLNAGASVVIPGFPDLPNLLMAS